MSRFDLTRAKNVPAWVQEVIHIAKGKTFRMKWRDVLKEPGTDGHKPGLRVTEHDPTYEDPSGMGTQYTFPWSFEFDDLVMEGCLAYLKALEKPGLENPGAYARTCARHAMGDLVIREGRSHGLIRDTKNGGMKRPSGVNVFRHYGRRGSSAKNAAKTHCIRGHPLSGDNVRYTPWAPRPGRSHNPAPPTRCCVTCKRERDRERQRMRRRMDPEGEKKRTRERMREWKTKQRAALGLVGPFKSGPKARTHCKNGHEMVGANVMVVKRSRPEGGTWKRCRVCHREKVKANRRARKEAVKALLNGSAVQGSYLDAVSTGSSALHASVGKQAATQFDNVCVGVEHEDVAT